MLINISSDNIEIIDNNQKKLSIHRNNADEVFPKKIVEMYQKNPFSKLFVINWPWWFTNLRVWVLVINLLNTFEKNKIWLFSTSKIEIFKSAFDNWILPKIWYINLWQKKNILKYNFENLENKIITKNEIDYKESFLDIFSDDKNLQSQQIKFFYNDNWIWIEFKNKKHLFLIQKCKQSTELKANYWISPIIWKQTQCNFI